jgi:phage terminase large subunit-like protein
LDGNVALAPEAKSTRSDLLHEKQRYVRDLMASGSYRHFLIYGGSRSGKTFLVCYIIATRALSAPESRHLIARLHNIDVRQAVMMDTWPAMMKLMYPGVKYTPNKADQYITFENGAEVWFGGLDDKERVEKILGKEYATIYVNESSQVSYDAILTLRTRLAQNVLKVNGQPLMQRAIYDLNPSGMGHWTYREFVEGVRPDNPEMKLTGAQRQFAVINPEDNPHLSQEYLDDLDSLPERHRKRFKLGEYLSEVPGTLWPLDVIESCRVDEVPHNVYMVRIVVALDPSGSDGIGGDIQGIIVAGLGSDGNVYILADRSCRLRPEGWGRVVVNAYKEFRADRVVGEKNFGGAMIASTIRTIDKKVAYKDVQASRGKAVRAEPVSSLYENGEVRHVGRFRALEDQMGLFTTDGFKGTGSPDRVDALVWAVTELKLKKQGYKYSLMEHLG